MLQVINSRSILCFILMLLTFFRYKVLSESADESTDPIYAKPKIVSEWQFDLNEAVIDIQVINDVVNKESRLVVLGEKNLFCLTDSGRLRFMNKLGYSPICMTCYVIGIFSVNFLVQND